MSCLLTQQMSCLLTQQMSCLQTQQMSCLQTHFLRFWRHPARENRFRHPKHTFSLRGTLFFPGKNRRRPPGVGAPYLANIGCCFGIYGPSSQGPIPISRSAGMVFLYLDQVDPPLLFTRGPKIKEMLGNIMGSKNQTKKFKSGIFAENVRDVPGVIVNPLGYYFGPPGAHIYLFWAPGTQN